MGKQVLDGPAASDLRVLHTADWHLGHTLHGHGGQAEHGAQ